MILSDILNYLQPDIKLHIKRVINNKPCETLFNNTLIELRKMMKDNEIPFLNSKYFLITTDIVGCMDFPNNTYIQPALLIYVLI